MCCMLVLGLWLRHIEASQTATRRLAFSKHAQQWQSGYFSPDNSADRQMCRAKLECEPVLLSYFHICITSTLNIITPYVQCIQAHSWKWEFSWGSHCHVSAYSYSSCYLSLACFTFSDSKMTSHITSTYVPLAVMTEVEELIYTDLLTQESVIAYM